MLFPNKASFAFRLLLAIPALAFTFAFAACGGGVLQKTEAEVLKKAPAPPPDAVPLWLGNASRNFYGTGPWPDRPVKVIWEFETELTSGRLHKDGWGGTSWPGQPSVAGNRVYFG